MLKKTGHFLLVIALIAMIGGHWAVLQTVAWTTMFADNLRSGNLSEAVERTFGGEHPCPLCKEISAGKKAEKKTDFAASLKKFEFVSDRPGIVLNPPQAFYLLEDHHDSVRGLSHQPPSPPPRRLAA